MRQGQPTRHDVHRIIGEGQILYLADEKLSCGHAATGHVEHVRGTVDTDHLMPTRHQAAGEPSGAARGIERSTSG